MIAHLLKQIKASQIYICLLTVVIIGTIWNVYIKSLFGITSGNIFCIYKDMLFIIFIAFALITFLIRPMLFYINKYDLIYIIFIIYSFIHILITYYYTNSLTIGIYKFRSYFIAYIMYLCFVFFFKMDSKYFCITVKLIKSVIVLSFVWAIAEAILINTKIIPIQSIILFLETSVPLGQPLYQISHNGVNYLPRTYGILADTSVSGIFYLIGFMAFMPESLNKLNNKNKLFILLGIIAIFVSFSKTALFLLIIILSFVTLTNKKNKIYLMAFNLLLICTVLITYNYHTEFKNMIDTMLFKWVPVYIERLQYFLLNASVMNLLFGSGYDVQKESLILLGLLNSTDITIVPLGSELFFVSIFIMWGFIGFIVYLLFFFFYPLLFYFKNKDILIKGMSMAVISGGLSSVHYNAIFHTGVDILVCLFAACLSYRYHYLKKLNKIGNYLA